METLSQIRNQTEQRLRQALELQEPVLAAHLAAPPQQTLTPSSYPRRRKFLAVQAASVEQALNLVLVIVVRQLGSPGLFLLRVVPPTHAQPSVWQLYLQPNLRSPHPRLQKPNRLCVPQHLPKPPRQQHLAMPVPQAAKSNHRSLLSPPAPVLQSPRWPSSLPRLPSWEAQAKRRALTQQASSKMAIFSSLKAIAAFVH